MRSTPSRTPDSEPFITRWLRTQVSNTKKEAGSSIRNTTIKSFLRDFYRVKKHEAQYGSKETKSSDNKDGQQSEDGNDDYTEEALEKEYFARTTYDVMRAFRVFSFKDDVGKDRMEIDKLKEVLALADPNLTDAQISHLLTDITGIMKRDGETKDFIISEVIPELILGSIPN